MSEVNEIIASPPEVSYQIVKVVKASCHQGNQKFGITAGIQCSCNALISVCWSVLKLTSRWGTNDLDFILEYGNAVFSKLDYQRSMSADELPHNVTLEGYSFTLDFIENVTAEMIRESRGLIHGHFLRLKSYSNGMLFFVNGYSFSILWNESKFYLFDPHSRNENGEFVANGTAVLLHFSSLSQVEKYIIDMYLVDRENLFFQMQFLKVTICADDRVALLQVLRQNKYVSFIGSPIHKERLQARKDKYASSIGSSKHKERLQARKDKYASFRDTPGYIELRKAGKVERASNIGSSKHKEQLKARKRKRASDIGSPTHKKMLSDQRKKYASSKMMKSKAKICSQQRIDNFKKKMREGPFYVCVVCNRACYKQLVQLFHKENYDIENEMFYFSRILSDNGCEYICKTCHKKLKSKKNQIPCQAVCNKLEIINLPSEFADLNRLERVLVAKRLLFKKVVIMPKGQFPKVKGAICNVPVEAEDVCNVLPRPADNNGLLLLKLKKKLIYRGHVYFEAVRPEKIRCLLTYLKENNHLYNNMEINLDHLSDELCVDDEDTANFCIIKPENPITVVFVDEGKLSTDSLKVRTKVPNESGANKMEEPSNNIAELEITENPLDAHRAASNETILTAKFPVQVEAGNACIAPGEDQRPLSVYNDEFCEEMAFPHLFPTGKFGYKVSRDVHLSPVKYFNQRLLNYTQKFASDSDYIFFAHHVVQECNLQSRINIALKKIAGNNLTAGMLSSNFKNTVKEFIANDQAYSFMNAIKGTPAYWKRFLHEVLSMVKQLGIPTLFLTLSCADLRWPELPHIIAKLCGLDLTEEEINNMSYHDRCKFLNMNPVFVARHFQYRLEVFFKEIVIDGPLGKVKHHVIRVEFQVRGSPHVHVFLWVTSSPLLTKDTMDNYVAFVDSIIRADLPDCEQEPGLFELVKTYQVHTHSQTCRKFKNQPCRFNFGHFFTERTIVAAPLVDEMSLIEKETILKNRKEILDKVKSYINSYLFPKTRNIIDPSKDDFECPETITDVLNSLCISEDDYYNALSISTDSDFDIHIRRPTNSCFVNNYFSVGLNAWEANMDIQPVFNHYKAITYMCKYLSKSEDECSKAMTQALEESRDLNSTKFEQMVNIAKAYVSHRECSVQEAVYHIMPELWLRKTFPAVKFVNSNLPEERYRMCRSKEELEELSEDCTDIFQRNMIDRYVDRPNVNFMNGKYQVLHNMCYALFEAYYYLQSEKDLPNDNLPVVLNDDLLESNNEYDFPPVVPLMNSKEKLKCRKVRAVLRYHVPNKHLFPEKYAHHLLFMYYPFRSESELKLQTYAEKLSQPEVLDIVNQNKQNIEPYGDLVDEALLNFTYDEIPGNMDPFGQQENDEVHLEAPRYSGNDDENEEEHQSSSGTVLITSRREYIISDDDLFARIRSLNFKQRQIFDLVFTWAKTFVKNRNADLIKEIQPLHIFLTGEGGCGKSHLIKTIYHALTRLFLHKGGDPEKQRVLLLAPTGVAAININGTTIHSGLGIYGNFFSPLSDKKRTTLRNKLEEISVIIIDEISMVSNSLLLSIHLRLCDIYQVSTSIPFAGKTIIACGDLYQLPPVRGSRVYHEGNNAVAKALGLWKIFKLAELTEVMRQRGDETFIDLLNNIRKGKLSVEDENILKSRFISANSSAYPHDVLHLFAENQPVNEHNTKMVNKLNTPEYIINAIDDVPKNVPESKIKEVQSRKQTDTGGLAYRLVLKIGAKVMLTANIDITDRLINGQIGIVDNVVARNGFVRKVYVKFADEKAGILRKANDPYGRINNVIPIERTEAEIQITKNKSSSPVIKRTQIPLALSWACTVHKVQGLSLSEAVISFKLNKQRSFNPGQMYVALSRVTSLNGLYLTGTYNETAIKSDENAFAEYNRLRQENVLSFDNLHSVSSYALDICVLNVRSLSRHALDIKHDANLTSNDILCLTETQLQSGQDTSYICENLDMFNIIFNNNEDKFLSIAAGVKKSVKVMNFMFLPGITYLQLQKPDCGIFSVCIIYRKNNEPFSLFLDCISNLIASFDIHILLGDFNINLYDHNLRERLQAVLQNYEIGFYEGSGSHIDGSLLDHIYVKRTFTGCYKSLLKCVYFSDHDAIQISLRSPTI